MLWRGAQGTDVLPRAQEVISRLKSMGKKVFLVTNNSTMTQDNLYEKCNTLGFNVQKVKVQRRLIEHKGERKTDEIHGITAS